MHWWVKSLQDFCFEIKFRLGKENHTIDALSQRVVALAISLVSSSLPKEIQHNILINELFGPIISKIYNQENQKTLEDYAMKEGLLFFKGHLCIPNSLRTQILKEAHESPLATHPRYQKMFSSLKEKFFWP